MRITWKRALLMVVAASSLVAGCSGSPTVGVPRPAGTPEPSQTAEASALPVAGVPGVSTPLNESVASIPPCEVITSAQFQAAAIVLREAKPKTPGTVGPECQWNVGEAGSGTTVGSIATANRRGLSGIYEQHQRGAVGLFEFIEPISGYPAAIYDRIDSRANGTCGVAVAIRDDLVYTVGVVATGTNPHRSAPCEFARDLAAMALKTLRSKS